MRYIILLTIIGLISCSSPQKKEELNNETEASNEIQNSISKISYLDSLKRSGLIIMTDSFDCNCGNNPDYIKYSVVIGDEDSKIRLCEFNFDATSEKLPLSGFVIYDCQKSEEIFSSNEQSANYRLTSINNPFSIVISSGLPDNTFKLTEQDFCRIDVTLTEGGIKLSKELFYHPKKLPEIVKDSILYHYARFSDNRDEYDPNFLDGYTVELFYGAMTNDYELQSAFENAKKDLGYDGAFSEFYSEYEYLYDLINENSSQQTLK